MSSYDPILLNFLVFALINGGAAFGTILQPIQRATTSSRCIAVNTFGVNDDSAQCEFAFSFQNIDGAERAGNRLITLTV